MRKKRGLTQAQVGAVMGVSQARVAEIEANPGLVNFEQVLQLLSVMGVTLSLQESDAIAGPAQSTQNNRHYNTNPSVHRSTYVKQETDAIYSVHESDAAYRAAETLAAPEIAAVAEPLRPATSTKQKMPPHEQAVQPVSSHQPQHIDDTAPASSGFVARTKKGVW